MTKRGLVSLLLLALTGFSSPSPANQQAKVPAKPAPPTVRETTFDGYLTTGITATEEAGGVTRAVLVFLDPAEAAAPESETPSTLLESAAANASQLRIGLAASMDLVIAQAGFIEGKPVKAMTFLAVYPLETLKLAQRTKSKGECFRAKPGKLTLLAQVIAIYGPARERQSWKGAAGQEFDMEGVV